MFFDLSGYYVYIYKYLALVKLKDWKDYKCLYINLF